MVAPYILSLLFALDCDLHYTLDCDKHITKLQITNLVKSTFYIVQTVKALRYATSIS